jgi:metallo-beta-lactamase family protein
MNIHFWGATEDVTGSMTFLEFTDSLIMIDCGLAQGASNADEMNLAPTPFSPNTITAVVITHAHLDHSGYLPRLVKNGFVGTIYCTSATEKLTRIILLDSAGLNEEGFYDEEDVKKTLGMIKIVDWGKTFTIGTATLQLLPAGHILGASSVLLRAEGKSLLFSGDLGRNDDPMLPAVSPAPKADVVIMEATYGAKNRQGDIKKELHSFLATVADQSRVGIIASFAVARGQTLLTLIHEFYEAHPQFRAKVVMDSPMMKEANAVYKKFSALTNKPTELYEAMELIDAIESRGEFDKLRKKSGPLIIVSSSGMLTGGRIARHLENWSNDEKAILFLPGYQGVGTPGRSFIEGHRTLKNKWGESFVWSGEVWNSDAFSSHADQAELVQWVSTHNKDSTVFLLHGETTSKVALQSKLQETHGGKVTIPHRGSVFKL